VATYVDRFIYIPKQKDSIHPDAVAVVTPPTPAEPVAELSAAFPEKHGSVATYSSSRFSKSGQSRGASRLCRHRMLRETESINILE
jgi:hypothetical protein